MNELFVVNNPHKTMGRRFFAGLLDSVICYLLTSILYLILCCCIGRNLSLPYYWITFALITYSYTIILTKKKLGTIGKKYFNINVVDYKTNSNITWKQSFKRELINIVSIVIYIIPMFIYIGKYSKFNYEDYFSNTRFDPIITITTSLFSLVSILEIISALFSKKRRAIHDFIGGTVVQIVGNYRFLSKPVTILISIIGYAIYFRLFDIIKKF